MQRRSLWGSTLALLFAATGIRTARAATPSGPRLVLHVGGADPAVMAGSLHNIANAADYYAQRAESVAIELVANGPGYTMLRADTSPVKAEVAATRKKYPFVVFSACQHSRPAMAAAEHKSLHDIVELPEATDVAAGIVRLAELQMQGYSYIRV